MITWIILLVLTVDVACIIEEVNSKYIKVLWIVPLSIFITINHRISQLVELKDK
ncbi:hypothetical protein [Clostridium sp.]|uniref:hypothetical protein n=1 Tax=Clostridium sp. TaxID=1506 RepID=UPI0025BED34B|nr:hypothetical protein [Clostridium sp.]